MSSINIARGNYTDAERDVRFLAGASADARPGSNAPTTTTIDLINGRCQVLPGSSHSSPSSQLSEVLRVHQEDRDDRNREHEQRDLDPAPGTRSGNLAGHAVDQHLIGGAA